MIARAPASLSTVQSHMQNRDFVVVTATLMTVTFCFYNSALPCFTLNETLSIHQQQALNFGYRNPGRDFK